MEGFGRVVTRETGRMERLVERLRALSRPANRPHHLLDVLVPELEAIESLQASVEEKRITVTERPRRVRSREARHGPVDGIYTALATSVAWCAGEAPPWSDLARSNPRLIAS